MKWEDFLKINKVEVHRGRTRNRDEEHQLQVSCVRWFRTCYPRYADLLFAVPNGGRRDKVTGSRLKAEGVLAGVADLLLLLPSGGSHGLCIEMKTKRNYQQTSQRNWEKSVREVGYAYVVCKSLDFFIETVGSYVRSYEEGL